MNEDSFNIAVRKFLKEVGVTSQREIEKGVRDALAAGTIDGTAALQATMTLDMAPNMNWPSMAMLTTPERSHMTPESEP